MTDRKKPVYQGAGYCPICECEVIFSADNEWFRDHLLCSRCASIPRERALMRVLMEHFPGYRELKVHESSPVNRGVSNKLKTECPEYSSSHYFDQVQLGQTDPQSGLRCESLESLTYPDGSFDLFITQDVMEHVFDPARAFREICRVLKPGGAHVFTVPIVNRNSKTQVRASRDESGEIIFHGSAEYHGNDIDDSGSLVTMHWGYDIVAHIHEKTGMPSAIFVIEDLSQGIKAELIEVIISWRV
ncbi:MAG: class I SAM-dependent methyltransferase [Lysobacterales bacterium]|jgi:SAM-dependent methyltransferase